jgi:hypothetical protein
MNLQWPVLAALLAAAVHLVLGKRAGGPVALVLAVVLATPVLVFVVFMIEMFWLAMSLSLAPILGGLAATGLLLALPALDALRRPNAWWASLLGLVATGAFLGVGWLQARPTPDRPAPSTLFYTLDRETGSARWATALDSTAGHPGVAWVRSRQVGFEETEDLTGYTGGTTFDNKAAKESFRVAAAQPILAPEPLVALVEDTLDARGRTVTVSVTSMLAAERLLFLLPEGATLSAVNGRELPTRDYFGDPVTGSVTSADHWGAPEAGVRLSFHVPGGAAALELTLVEHLLRPGELLGEEAFRRPPDLAPDVRRFSDRLMIRTPLRVPLGEIGDVPVVPGGDPSPPDSLAVADSAATVEPAPPDTSSSASAAASPGPGESGAPDTAEVPRPDSTTTKPDPSSAPPDTSTAAPDSSGTAYDSRWRSSSSDPAVLLGRFDSAPPSD